MENLRIPDSELEKPLSQGKIKLPLLPELEMLEAVIIDVQLQYAVFGGKPVYVVNKNQETVLDSLGQPIQKKEFVITFSMNNFTLPDGKNRRQWLKLGASISEKSKLKKFLTALGINVIEGEIKTLKQLDLLVKSLKGYTVKFQLINKPDSEGNIWQNINFDSIRFVSKPTQKQETKTDFKVNPEDIVWEE